HLSRDCLSEKKIKNDKAGESRRPWSQTKLLKFCKISLDDNEESREMYNIRNESLEHRNLKRSSNPNWNNRLRDRKMAKTKPVQEEEGGKSRMEGNVGVKEMLEGTFLQRLFELIEVVPQSRAAAVERVENAQKSAKIGMIKTPSIGRSTKG
ncbi:9613_t:CDS:2, partial [Gigaspora rosea]